MDLPKQFVIHRNPLHCCEDWQSDRIGDSEWTVSISRQVPITRILNDDRVIALALGWFVYEREAYFSSGILCLPKHTNLVDAQAEFCGRFVVIELCAATIRVSSDAGALLPVVFDEELTIVGSTPKALSMLKEFEHDAGVERQLRRRDGKTWYPFGIVPFKGLRRLLPGCQLSLATGEVRALWDPRRCSMDQTSNTADIMRLVSEYIAAMARYDSLSAHLTGGYDSRMVLAACIRAGVRPHLTTVLTGDKRSELDFEIARRLADLAKLKVRPISYLRPSASEVEDWRERTSGCIADSVVSLCRTVRERDDGRYTLTGTCGEVGRGFYWSKGDLMAVGIDPGTLIEKLGFEKSPMLTKHAERWLERFPSSTSRPQILDEAYIDHRLGGWAGPAVYGHLIAKPTLSPFNSRMVYDKLAALPVVYRFEQQFAREFVALAGENLAAVPFNRASGLGRLKFWREEVKALIPYHVKRSARWIMGRATRYRAKS